MINIKKYISKLSFSKIGFILSVLILFYLSYELFFKYSVIEGKGFRGKRRRRGGIKKGGGRRNRGSKPLRPRQAAAERARQAEAAKQRSGNRRQVHNRFKGVGRLGPSPRTSN